MAAICAQLRSNTDVYYRFQEKGSAVACYHGWIEVQPKAEQSLCISGRLGVDFPESFSLAHTDPTLPLGCGEASVIRTPSCRRTRSDQTGSKFSSTDFNFGIQLLKKKRAEPWQNHLPPASSLHVPHPSLQLQIFLFVITST